jgi:hypothetical protein
LPNPSKRRRVRPRWWCRPRATAAGEVSPHQHDVVTAEVDRVPVGPNACDDGPSIQFDNFHNNGHAGVPGSLGVVVGGGCT